MLAVASHVGDVTCGRNECTCGGVGKSLASSSQCSRDSRAVNRYRHRNRSVIVSHERSTARIENRFHSLLSQPKVRVTTCRQSVGIVLAACWQRVGKMLAKCWQNVGEMLTSVWVEMFSRGLQQSVFVLSRRFNTVRNPAFHFLIFLLFVSISFHYQTWTNDYNNNTCRIKIVALGPSHLQRHLSFSKASPQTYVLTK